MRGERCARVRFSSSRVEQRDRVRDRGGESERERQ